MLLGWYLKQMGEAGEAACVRMSLPRRSWGGAHNVAAREGGGGEWWPRRRRVAG